MRTAENGGRFNVKDLAKKIKSGFNARAEAYQQRYIGALKNEAATLWERSILSNHHVYDVVRDAERTPLEVTRDPQSSKLLPKWLIEQEGQLVPYTDKIRDTLSRKTGFNIGDVQTLTYNLHGKEHEFSVLTGYAKTPAAKKLVGV